MSAEELLITVNLDKTVWGERIIQAEAMGKFTRSNRESASKWTTCACGKLDKRIPRRFNGPVDDSLSNFGEIFYSCIRDDNFYSAADILIKIENRAALILARLMK